MPDKPSKLLFSFEDTQLLIKRGTKCTHRIRIWPRPEAERTNGDGYWERFYPEFRLIGYPARKPKKKITPQLELGLDIPANPVKKEPTKKETYELLRQTIPTSYTMALAPFKSHQWNMVVYLSFHRRFYELIKGNPALAFLLANRREFNWKVYRKEIKLEDLTGMKQQELLGLLGLPETKKMVQLTKKIHPSSISLNLIEYFNYYLQNDDVVKKLSHLKKINSGVLSLLANLDILGSSITPQFLEEVSTNRPNNHYPLASLKLQESRSWHKELRPRRKFPIFRTLEALNIYHEELAEQLDTLFQDANCPADERLEMVKMMNRKPFPSPPIAGTETIVPLRSALELSIEGNRQHNCVASYTNRVHKGNCYIYRVLNPQRATLSIVKTASGEWTISELFIACNRPAEKATRQSVHIWLTNAQLGIG